MSGPDLPEHRAVLAAVNTAARRYRGGLRPMLTAAAQGAYSELGRGGKTPPSRTEKHHRRSGPIILLNLTHITDAGRDGRSHAHRAGVRNPS